MRAEVQRKIYDVAAQQVEVLKTTSQRKYQALVTNHFYEQPDDEWLSFCKTELAKNPDWTTNPEYFRFLGQVGIVAAQFGFPQLEGQLSRYLTHNWSKQSPISPRHQLAVATYTADLNLKSIRIKEDIISNLDDPKLEPGVWGLFFYPNKDKLEHPTHVEDLRREATERLQRNLPICLPDKELNKKLASLQFSGDDAERMPQEEFERDIFPEVQKITEGLAVNPKTIFVQT